MYKSYQIIWENLKSNQKKKKEEDPWDWDTDEKNH